MKIKKKYLDTFFFFFLDLIKELAEIDLLIFNQIKLLFL